MILLCKQDLRAWGCIVVFLRGTSASVLLEMCGAYPEVSEVVSHLTFAFCLFLSLSSLSSAFLSLSSVMLSPSFHRAGERDEAQAEPAEAVAWGHAASVPPFSPAH